MTTRNATTNDVARGVLDSLDDARLVLKLPHTDYRLHLKLAGPPERVTTPVGKRIRGTIEGKAQRMHPTAGGGRFIEPIIGEPRIIVGTVLQVDEPKRRVLVDVAVPMWLEAQEGQDFSIFQPGRLVTGYVASGATFTPASE